MKMGCENAVIDLLSSLRIKALLSLTDSSVKHCCVVLPKHEPRCGI